MSGSAGVPGVPHYTPKPLICSVHEGGKPCTAAATTQAACTCTRCGRTKLAEMCERHTAFMWMNVVCTHDEARSVWGEPIDLTRADPGREYADMLRSL